MYHIFLGNVSFWSLGSKRSPLLLLAYAQLLPLLRRDETGTAKAAAKAEQRGFRKAAVAGGGCGDDRHTF